MGKLLDYFSLLTQALTNLKYYVFEVNLKGTLDLSDVGWVLKRFSSNVVNTIVNMKGMNEMKCIYNALIQFPDTQESWTVL